MSDERRRVLQLLADGKLTADEAAELLDRITPVPRTAPGGTKAGAAEPSATATAAPPRYLRVEVRKPGEERVDVRVPLQLIRSGARFMAFMPATVQQQVSDALGERGLELDCSRRDPQQLDDLLRALADLSIEIEDGGETIRVFCE